MKKMRRTKLTATLLAIMMLVMSMSTFVFADVVESETASSTDGTLIIENTPEDSGMSIATSSCYLYEIFNYHIDEGSQTLNYEVEDTFKDFFVTELGITDDDAFNANAISYVENCTDLQTLVASLQAWIDSNDIEEAYEISSVSESEDSVVTSVEPSEGYDEGVTISKLNTSGGVESITVTGLETGYYLILDTGAFSEEEQTLVTAGALVTIPRVAILDNGMTYSDVTVTVKGSQPTIDKEVWHNDASSWENVSDYQIGDKVEYKVTATIPTNLTGYTSYTYEISDILPSGVSYSGDLTVYTDANLTKPLSDSYYSIDTESNGFTFKIKDMITFKSENSTVEELYLVYSGKLLETAVVFSEAEINTVKLEYSNNPYDKTSTNTIDDSVKTYTFDMEVTKTKGDGSTALADAVFQLSYKSGDDYIDIYLADTDTKTDEGVPIYVVSSGTIDVDSETDTYKGVIVTGDTGKFVIQGLDDEVDYKLTEIEAPEGYNLAAAVEFKIHASYSDEGDVITATGLNYDNNELTVKIINTSASLLPETGGMGTTLFMIIGATMMFGAAVILVVKRATKVTVIDL